MIEFMNSPVEDEAFFKAVLMIFVIGGTIGGFTNGFFSVKKQKSEFELYRDVRGQSSFDDAFELMRFYSAMVAGAAMGALFFSLFIIALMISLLVIELICLFVVNFFFYLIPVFILIVAAPCMCKTIALRDLGFKRFWRSFLKYMSQLKPPKSLSEIIEEDKENK